MGVAMREIACATRDILLEEWETFSEDERAEIRGRELWFALSCLREMFKEKKARPIDLLKIQEFDTSVGIEDIRWVHRLRVSQEAKFVDEG